jgi:hypothetical protein
MLSSTTYKVAPSRSTIIRRVLIRLICFAIAECWLNAVNLDTLADYQEFMQKDLEVTISQHQIVEATDFGAIIALVS